MSGLCWFDQWQQISFYFIVSSAYSTSWNHSSCLFKILLQQFKKKFFFTGHGELEGYVVTVRDLVCRLSFCNCRPFWPDVVLRWLNASKNYKTRANFMLSLEGCLVVIFTLIHLWKQFLFLVNFQINWITLNNVFLSCRISSHAIDHF